MPSPGHRFDAEYRTTSSPGFDRARVHYSTRGLVIEREGAPPLVWPYPSLGSNSTVPIAGSSKVVLVSTANTGATLTLDDATFLPSLLQSAPQLRGRGQAKRGPDWLPMVATTIAFFAAIGGLIWAIWALFPYKAVARRIPVETREEIGKLALSELTKGHKKCEQAPGNTALSKLVDRLAKVSGTDIKFRVQVVDWSLVNAFAVMGNQIVLTKGLLQKASSPDEIAGVLGHEMGHSIEVHPESAVLRALGTVIGIQVLVGGWSPDLVSQAATQLLLLRHSRSNETEADDVALRLLKGAGISPGPFAGFFEKISQGDEKKKVEDKGYKLPDVFSTHPPPPERAARARAQQGYPSTPALEPAEWEALRKICG